MKLLFVFFIVLQFNCYLNSQHKSSSGILPVPKIMGSTYAVVVGISDYQNPDIPDLQYADKDALAFASYLMSPAGGSLKQQEVKLLINEQATMAQFANALDWLWDVCKEVDKAIIYFSGHGDVEKKSLMQPGFLLCWDSPARVYMAGGAFGLPMLQEVISTLSIKNKSKVIVIADACRSGSLAGSSVGGAQATTANLAKQFANEIKILSCHPNEYSIEGDQWGDGRGAFSFHLIDALYGLADLNQDNWVTLHETGRYLEDHVTTEVAPVSQIPMVIGNRQEILTKVDTGLIASIKLKKSTQSILITMADTKPSSNEILSKLNEGQKQIYNKFLDAVKNKIFLEPVDNCAERYFVQLIQQLNSDLIALIARSYAAALQDETQQVINNLLSSDLKEISLSQKTKILKYQTYPKYLERAANLLGTDHYMYNTLQSRKHFFSALLVVLFNSNIDKNKYENALVELQLSLNWVTAQPHVYWLMSWIYSQCIIQPDSAINYTAKAMDLSPSWSIPNVDLAYMFIEKLGQADNALPYLIKAHKIDSNSLYLQNAWAIYFVQTGQIEKAELKYLQLINIDSNYIDAHNNLGLIYAMTNRPKEAEQKYFKAIELDSTYVVPYYNLACLYSLQKLTDKSFEFLDLAIHKGFNNYDWMQQDADLALLREQKITWNKLMEKYFPDKK